MDVIGIKRLDQFGYSDFAFVFVAVIACGNEQSGSDAVLDRADWDREPTIGRGDHRVRHTQEAGVFAVLVKRGFGGDERIGHELSFVLGGLWPWWGGRSSGLEGGGREGRRQALAAADADHGHGERVCRSVLADELAEEAGDEDCSGCAERVTESDGAAVSVWEGFGDVQGVEAGEDLRGKGLVEFEVAELVERQVWALVQKFL